MQNSVIKPNEYGVLSQEEFDAFLARNGLKLPKDYIEFMVLNNGGKLKNNLHLGDYPGESISLSHIYSFGQNVPEHTNLESEYRIGSYYALDDRIESARIEHFFVFAISGTGALFLIDQRSGKVAIYYHDELDELPIKNVEKSFSSFIDELANADEFYGDDDDDPEFAALLARANQLRQRK